MNNYIITAIAVLALLVGGYAALKPHSTVVNQVGAASGPDHYGLEQFFGGLRIGGQVSSTTQGSATLTAAEFTGWSQTSLVSLLPNLVASATFTFPASSTIPNVVPNAGDRQTFCIRNATTTANVQMTLAGGTGTNLVVASSSVSAVGGKVLISGKVGCVTLIREAKTSTSFDIDALLTVFQ